MSRKLLERLLSSDSQEDVVDALRHANVWEQAERWRWLGDAPNNKSIVHAQQSKPEAALAEKITNSIDAILIGFSRRHGINPRGPDAPSDMDAAVEQFLGSDLEADPVAFADSSLILYATGARERPSLSLYDAGEGQLARDFPETFCSLIHSRGKQTSNKGGIPFVQGRFNMGSTGILRFCAGPHHLQLIVSRPPSALVGRDDHQWGFTVLRYRNDPWRPGWQYLVGDRECVLQAGAEPLRLIPKAGPVRSNPPQPREQSVHSGSLVKMYEYTGTASNVCSTLFDQLERILVRPRLPLRVIECRPGRTAKVMKTTIWAALDRWCSPRVRNGERIAALEPEFEHGASFVVELSTGEQVPGEIRVFTREYERRRGRPAKKDGEQALAGLYALINGQVHARRDSSLFKGSGVRKEHIAGSMLVTLDCRNLSPGTRGDLFMADRERFCQGPLLDELLKKLRIELRDHGALKECNERRYQEKIATATEDRRGLEALEAMLLSDPSLASLFASPLDGQVPASPEAGGGGSVSRTPPQPFEGARYPSFFRSSDGTTDIVQDIPAGGGRRPSFVTDVENLYLRRKRHRGRIETLADNHGLLQSTSLHNGRLQLSLRATGSATVGERYLVRVRISDAAGSGPFELSVRGEILPKNEPATSDRKVPRKPRRNTSNARASRLIVRDVTDREPSDPPLSIESAPDNGPLELHFNLNSSLLEDARNSQPRPERARVDFVFKYGLALATLAMVDHDHRAKTWDPAKSPDRIHEAVRALARVVVPLCLTLPRKLPGPS